jgi:hypothetical protein
LASAALVVAAGAWPGQVSAGPPLIADDPNTIGPRNAQPIVAATVLRRRDETVIRGPVLDQTVGAADSLDVTLIVSFNSIHRTEESRDWRWLGVITPGIKWQFFRRDRGSLCLSPAFSVGTAKPDGPLLLLPLQGEIAVGERTARLGFDAGYRVGWSAPDEWFASIYGQIKGTERLTIQGEVWSFGSSEGRRATLGLTVGATYLVFRRASKRLDLLVALSPGLASFNRPKLDVRAYVGFQYTFARPRRLHVTVVND